MVRNTRLLKIWEHPCLGIGKDFIPHMEDRASKNEAKKTVSCKHRTILGSSHPANRVRGLAYSRCSITEEAGLASECGGHGGDALPTHSLTGVSLGFRDQTGNSGPFLTWESLGVRTERKGKVNFYEYLLCARNTFTAIVSIYLLD